MLPLAPSAHRQTEFCMAKGGRELRARLQSTASLLNPTLTAPQLYLDSASCLRIALCTSGNRQLGQCAGFLPRQVVTSAARLSVSCAVLSLVILALQTQNMLKEAQENFPNLETQDALQAQADMGPGRQAVEGEGTQSF